MDRTTAANKRLYRPWWGSARVQRALAQGLLETGELRVNAKQPEEAFVKSKRYGKDIFINGTLYRNRALDGDLVAVLVQARPLFLASTGCETPSSQSQDPRERGAAGTSSTLIDLIESGLATAVASETLAINSAPTSQAAAVTSTDTVHVCGRVVAVIERRYPRRLFGQVESRDGLLYLRPDDLRLPLFRIDLERFARSAKDLLLKQVGRPAAAVFTGTWGTNETYPRCELLRLWVGDIDLDAEMSLIRYKFAVPSIIASTWAMPSDLGMGLCSEGTAGVDGVGNSEDRRDFRWSTRVFSIDPANARDVDDALSIKWDPTEQCYRVGIHIADVSHFVRPGTALDREAAQRGNSFYFVDHLVPMLPPTLCEDLCSLLPGADRKTVSMEILLTADGSVKRDPWIGRGLVRSCAKLSYADARRILSAPTPGPRPDTLEADVGVLYRLASRLRQRRLERGALCLGHRQIVLNWAADENHEHHVQIEPRDEAHWLVEEFMLLANEHIARFLTRHCPENALLRRHPAFDETQLHRIAEWAAKRRYTLDISDTKAIQTSLDALASSAQAAFYAVRNKLAKAMANAEYVCAADFEDPVAYRHTALDLDVYTHFTSPIRRYADLVVHRQVLLALDAIPDETLRLQTRAALNAQTISAISGHCNQRKRDAEAAQTAATWLHLALEFHHRPREYDAIITGFVNRHQALQLYVPLLDLEVILDIGQDLGAVVRRHAESTSTGLEELELYWSPSVWHQIRQGNTPPALIVKPPKNDPCQMDKQTPDDAGEASVLVRELDTCSVALHGEIQPLRRLRVRMILVTQTQTGCTARAFQAAQQPFPLSGSETCWAD